MNIIKMAQNLLSSSANKGTNTLWELCKALWDNAENNSKRVKEAKDYWLGNLQNKITSNFYFPDQNRSNCNIIKPIVETKLKNMLDAQFSIAVVPDIGSFFDITAIKDAQAVADILNDEIKHILKNNDMSALEEKIARDAYIGGYGASQVVFDTKEHPDGVVKIEYIPAEDLRWSKGAKDKPNYWAFSRTLPIVEAKSLFGKDPDGTFNEEMCKKIDTMAKDSIQDRKKINGNNAVINYINTENNTGGQAYAVSNSGGIQSGKVVNLVYMYLVDESVYAPAEQDPNEEAELKAEGIKAYPNGRIIVFSSDDSKKIILKDEPAPEALKDLGNIDIFNSTQWDDLSGKGEVDDLAPIQDRINGLFAKYREKVSFDFDTILMDSDFGIEDNSLVRGGVTKVDGYNKDTKQISEPMSNNGIEKATQILTAIDILKKQAYEVARVNETMLYGTRQTGTTSADQVDALQESPMTDIRSAQRNFKNYKISVAEKVLNFIVANYSKQRMINISGGSNKAKYAVIDTNQVDNEPQSGLAAQQIPNNEPQIKQEKVITLYDEAMAVVDTIKFNDDWKFKVDCIAGTEIPRSRKETALLIDRLAVSPIMQTGDLDLIELYLLGQDFPDARAWIKVLREREKNTPKPTPLEKISKDPAMLTAWGNLFKDLTGFSLAQGQLLKSVGLDGSTDTIASAPAQSITAKSSADKIAVITPTQVSKDVPEAVFGHQQATDIQILEHANKSGGNNGSFQEGSKDKNKF